MSTEKDLDFLINNYIQKWQNEGGSLLELKKSLSPKGELFQKITNYSIIDHASSHQSELCIVLNKDLQLKYITKNHLKILGYSHREFQHVKGVIDKIFSKSIYSK